MYTCVEQLLFMNMFSIRSSCYVISLLTLVATSYSSKVSSYRTEQSNCPKDAQKRVRSCNNILQNFKNIPEDSRGSSSGPNAKMNMIRESCRSSNVLQVGKCISDTLDKCKGTTEEEQILQRLFDKDSQLETVNYFCNNLDVYTEHYNCIRQQHNMSIQCSKEESMSIQRKQRYGSSMDVMIQASCSLHTVSLNCFSPLVGENCGESAAIFLERIFLGMRPPACSKLEPKWGSNPRDKNGQTVTKGGYTVLAALVIASVCLVWP